MDKELTKVLRTLTRKNDKEKRSNTLIIVFAIIGAAAVIGVVCYLIYRFMKPDYFEDYDDDYDDDEYEEDEDTAKESEETAAPGEEAEETSADSAE